MFYIIKIFNLIQTSSPILLLKFMNNKFCNAPAWSIPSSKTKDRLEPNNKLGPAAYNVSRKKSQTPCWKIGEGERSDIILSENPGPGDYYITSRKYGPRITIATKHENRRQTTTPGPGEYNILNIPTKEISYTIGYKYGEREKKQSPASCSQNKSEEKIHCIGGKIGKSKRSTIKNEVPGPGNYEISSSLSGPKHKFSTYSQTKSVSKNPGPAQYNIKIKLKTEQKGGITMGQKFESMRKLSEYPGPGSYDLRIQKSKSGGKINKSHKISEQKDNRPGPATYNNSLINNKKEIKIAISKRQNSDHTFTPGPGTYQSFSKYQSGIKISAFRPSKKISRTPGVGTYSVQIQKKVTCGTIGQQKRDFSKASNTPGPGYYNYKENVQKRFAETRAKRGRKLRTEPGPADYEIKASFPSAPPYSYLKKNSLSKDKKK